MTPPLLCSLFLLTTLAFAGCVSTQPLAVSVQGDNYCAIAAKIRWSMQDTRETITQVSRENAKWDRACRPRKPPKVS
jgi:hypothetical protein